jgi:hypothetical protein
MEGPHTGKGIDPQMIRDHGAQTEVLDQGIREIEREALEQQAHLVQVRPMPAERPHRRPWRHRG